MTTLTTSPATASGAPKPGHNKTRPRTPSEWILMILAVLGAALVVFPMLLLLLNAFKSPADYANSSPLDFPEALDFTGIQTFWETQNFPRALWNSIFISGMVAILAVILSVLNSFAIGIGRVKGRTWIVLAEGPEAEIDAAADRQRRSDPDLWVIEVEDRQGRHLLDEPGLAD